MAEELFTDIINNLGKAVKKIKGDKPGKFFVEPYFNPDGSRKIVGGYGAEDRAAFIEKNKDGIKGTVQYGNDDTNKKFRLTSDGKNTTGEVIFKFADGGITTPKRGLVDAPGSYSGSSAYENIKKLGIESQIKQLYSVDGFGANNIATRLKSLFPAIADKINSTLIGDYIKYANSNLNLIKPTRAVRNQYGPIRTLEEVQTIVDKLPKKKKGNNLYKMNLKDLEGRSEYSKTEYITRKELDKYKTKLKNLGPSRIVKKPDAKTDANKKRATLEKEGNAAAGKKTVAENKKISTKFVTQANLKLRQDLKKNSTETINKIRNNKKIMFELENSFDSKSGEFKTEKVSNKKIKSLIKGGMFSMEHTSPMVAGAKNTNFTTNLSLITNRANSKIMRPLDTFLNSNSYKDFSDPRVVKAKNFLSKNNLRIKIKNDGKPIYFGDETKFESAAERINKQSKGYRLNSGLAAVENGARGIFSNVKNVAKNIAGNIKNIGNVDFSNMSLGEGKLAKAAGVGKNIVKVGGKLLGAAAIPLTAYELNRMYNEGSTAAEMLAYPLFLDGRVREGQELLKMSKAEKQSMMNQQIEEDESLLDSDFSTPYVKGVNSVDNKIVRERVALELQAEKEARKLKRTKKSSGFTFGNNYGISSFDDQV